jgi:hypothetical protein
VEEESTHGPSEACSDVEYALPGCLFDLVSILRRPDGGRKGLEVEFAFNAIDLIIVPQYSADPYRLISISKVPPEIRPIADVWEDVVCPYRSKYYGWDYRGAMRARVKNKQHWNRALAQCSAILFSLEPGVDEGELPEKWPTIATRTQARVRNVRFPYAREQTPHMYIQASPLVFSSHS